MLLPTPLFPGCKKHDPVTVAIRTVNGKKGPDVSLNAGDIPIAPGSESSVQDEIKGIHGVLSSTGSFKKIEDYLYEADCPLPNAELAEEHFRARFGKDAPPSAAGFAACSVLNHDGLIGRAYDWKYDDAVTFVVHTPANGDRFASVSICSSPAGITKESVEAHAVPASLWTVLPFYAVDGMNENGVTCSVCVVHGKGSEDILWHGKEFCAVGAVRHVLDRARTAEEGADIIASEAWMPASEKLGGYSLHFMVTDEAHTFIVEDGVVIDITDDDVKAMTNFRLGSRSFLDETGHADVDKIASYDPYGTGVERYNVLIDYAKVISEEVGMRMWLTGLRYSDAYKENVLTGSTPRPSEFAGTEISRDRFAKINETEAIKAWFKSAKVHEKWALRERDGKFWQTVHSAVYDAAARTVSVVVQEGTAVHDFPIVRDGGSGTVKSVNDVEPDSKTGNVALTAHDIPYGGEGASNVETAIEQNTQAIGANAEAIDSVEQQLGELKDDTYTKSEVDDKINQSAAHYLTADAEGSAFDTVDALKNATTYYYAGEAHTPDKNDYAVVLDDGGKTARWAFFGEGESGVWQRQYYINETTLTQEQWKAVNSGITADLLAQLARKSDIPITTADIEDYENYRGHWDLAALYMTGDIVRAVKASTGEVAYFKSLVDNNRGVNPFTEGQNRWERTEDDEGLEKLTLFVKAAIAGMTGADIPVSPTNADKIDVALGKKLNKSDVTAPASDTALKGKSADAYETGVKLNKKVDDIAGSDGWRVVATDNEGGGNYFEIWHKEGEAPYFKIGSGDKKITLPFKSGTLALVSQISGITAQDITDFLHYKGDVKVEGSGSGASLLIGYDEGDIVNDNGVAYSADTYVKFTRTQERGDSYIGWLEVYEPTEGFKKLLDLYGKNKALLFTDTAFSQKLHYALNNDGTIKDRAVNKLTWTAESESHSFSLDANLPAPVDGVGRDFLVQIHTDAAVDITSALALKGDLPSITEAGDYILAFTELHDNMWLVKKLTLEDAQ